jgi:ABC-type molybdate transport system permease subunit
MGKVKQAVSALSKGLICKKRYLGSLLLSALFMLNSAIPAYASGVTGSKIVTGTEKLITDVTTWLMVLAPVLAGLLIIYFCIRRSAADEMDTKKWNNRIIVAVMSCLGAILGSATLNLIIEYYK